MSLLSQMESAGLGRALKDARNISHTQCSNRHSGMRRQQGWDYCPFCGLKLEVNTACPDCGKDFYTAESFEKHRKPVPQRCPKCHSSRYVKRYRKAHCVDCGKTRSLKLMVICSPPAEGGAA